MTVKSTKKVYQKRTATNNPVFKITQVKKRGRPPGSKNKPKESAPSAAQVVINKRGRPPGLKNKPRSEQPSDNKVVRKTVKSKQDSDDSHSLSIATTLDSLVKWLEKKMHPSEMQYYKSRASKQGATVQDMIIADILGFFNVQDPEINKHVKKNNFIATIKNELHQQN